MRKIFGYLRLDSTAVLALMNDLYVGELRVYQNLFQPSTKLLRKTRVGSRLRRVYEPPKTPLERVRECGQADRGKLAQLDQTFKTHDPFELSTKIDLAPAISAPDPHRIGANKVVSVTATQRSATERYRNGLKTNVCRTE